MLALKCGEQEEGVSEDMSKGIVSSDLPFDRVTLSTYYVVNKLKAGNGGSRKTR